MRLNTRRTVDFPHPEGPIKAVILFAVGRRFGLDIAGARRFAVAMAQGGEFAFVLLSFAKQSGVLTTAQTGPLIAAVALSMALTPLAMLINERLVRPRLGTRETVKRPPDEIEGNVCFNNGSPSRNGQRTANVYIGATEAPVEDIVFRNNHAWHSPPLSTTVQFGIGLANGNLVARFVEQIAVPHAAGMFSDGVVAVEGIAPGTQVVVP